MHTCLEEFVLAGGHKPPHNVAIIPKNIIEGTKDEASVDGLDPWRA